MVKIHLSNQDLLARKLTFFFFLEEDICCWYSSEVPQGGTFYEYPQYMFSLRNKKIYISYSSQLELWRTCPRTSKLKCLTCPQGKGRLDKFGMLFPRPFYKALGICLWTNIEVTWNNRSRVCKHTKIVLDQWINGVICIYGLVIFKQKVALS